MHSMRYHWRRFNYWLDRYMTRGVKWIVLINLAVFLLESLLVLVEMAVGRPLGVEAFFVSAFAQNPIVRFVRSPLGGYETRVNWLCAVQFFTYMFLHANVWHLFWNMLALWFFGPPLEGRWGTVRFLKFYCFTGFAAGALHGLLAPILLDSNVVMLGASGAVFGVLLAFGILFPNQPVLLWFILPMPSRVFVALIGLLTFFALISGAQPGISHLTHLAGLGFGYLWLHLHRIYPGAWLFNSDPRPFPPPAPW